MLASACSRVRTTRTRAGQYLGVQRVTVPLPQHKVLQELVRVLQKLILLHGNGRLVLTLSLRSPRQVAQHKVQEHVQHREQVVAGALVVATVHEGGGVNGGSPELRIVPLRANVALRVTMLCKQTGEQFTRTVHTKNLDRDGEKRPLTDFASPKSIIQNSVLLGDRRTKLEAFTSLCT
jgi:hypothetical protein